MVCPVTQSASSLSSQPTRRAVSVGVLQRAPGFAAVTAARLRVGVAGVVGAGVDAVDGDAAGHEVDGEAAGELVQGCLGAM
jgi:hypothetical protein